MMLNRGSCASVVELMSLSQEVVGLIPATAVTQNVLAQHTEPQIAPTVG